MTKKFYAILAIMVILITGTALIAGCIQPTTPAIQNVKVIMPFVASSEWVPVYAAINQGYYADEGLNVSVEYTSEGGYGSIKQVAAGNAQFGYSGGDSVILARSLDVPVVSVYQVDHNNAFGILSKKSANITKPEDMIGKSIAISAPGGSADISIKAILQNSGVGYENVTFIPVGSAMLSMLVSDKTNAMPDHIMFEELLNLQGVPYNTIKAKDYGANLVVMTLITSENTVKSNPDLVRKFVRATDKGLKYSVANPEKSVDDYIKNFNPDANALRSYEQTYWSRMVNEIIMPTKYTPGSFNRDQWVTTQDLMYNMSYIDKKTDVNALYTTAFLPS